MESQNRPLHLNATEPSKGLVRRAGSAIVGGPGAGGRQGAAISASSGPTSSPPSSRRPGQTSPSSCRRRPLRRCSSPWPSSPPPCHRTCTRSLYLIVPAGTALAHSPSRPRHPRPAAALLAGTEPCRTGLAVLARALPLAAGLSPRSGHPRRLLRRLEPPCRRAGPPPLALRTALDQERQFISSAVSFDGRFYTSVFMTIANIRLLVVLYLPSLT